MKKNNLWRTFVILFAVIFVVSGVFISCAPKEEEKAAVEKAEPAEKKVLLKVPICFATSLPGLGTSILELAEQLGKASGGSVVMKVYEPGKLVAPFEILDAVSEGKVNAGYFAAGYWEGKMPGISLFTAIPFGPALIGAGVLAAIIQL